MKTKKPISWQISEATIAKVKEKAKQNNQPIQVTAENLLLVALEGNNK